MEKTGLICGIDEAGRGPLAGPVTASCVILPFDFDFSILNDSKKLTPKKREMLNPIIKEKALAWSVAHVGHEVIDEINILQATLLAMKTAFETLHDSCGNKIDLTKLPVSSLIVDGLYVPDFGSEITSSFGKVDCQPLVKADAKIPAVMAASILAKTERDKLMCEFARQYPQYEYEKHKGYPTKRHVELIKKYGISPIQRKSFKIPQ